ncbi:HalOD1 output domain-containing protein [Halomarina rubra]|uniref:HalOD1 output domain-containing protein n=1 Tax=Halomarina rubra TaxID=2071873 RepID=A0ABD6AVC7_9EURY|nr:HalOD1 output domain-containing protein [Halomarina rubra]
MSQKRDDNLPMEPDESLSYAVVSAVAAEKGVSPDALEPVLYDVVEPDALDALFAPRRDGAARTTGTATFELAEYEVTVDADGSVSLATNS